jgi:Kef-type K+ transport system membrane component KefB
MDASEVLLQLAIILLAARIAGEVAMQLGAPSVIGELTVGVILGPGQLGWVHPTEFIDLLAEIGIILLLFQVGLEANVRRLAAAGGEAMAVAIGGVLVPLALGYLLSREMFDLPVLTSLFVGGAMTATSIGVTIRILRDLGREHSKEGQVVLGAAVVDDLLGVMLLALLFQFSTSGGVNLMTALNLILFLLMFFIVAPIAAEVISAILNRYGHVTELPGLVATLIVSLVLFFAWVAYAVGAPELLGGFVVGLALSRRFFSPFGARLAPDREFSEEVKREIRPIAQLFTPIFFVSVGLSLDLTVVNWSSPFVWVFSLSLAFLAIFGKVAAGYLLWREHWLQRMAIGMAMVPRGEVGLVFAELGHVAGVLEGEVYAAVVLVIVYTTVFSPFWIKLFYRRYGAREALAQRVLPD